MTLTEIFEKLNTENYELSVKEMYKIQESDKRDWEQLSEFEKDIYCWLTDDAFNPHFTRTRFEIPSPRVTGHKEDIRMIIKSEIKREKFSIPLNNKKRANTLSASWRTRVGGKDAIVDEDYVTMVRTTKILPCDEQGNELEDRFWCSFCGNTYAQYPQIPAPESPFPCVVPCKKERQDEIEIYYLNDTIVESIKCCGHFTHYFPASG